MDLQKLYDDENGSVRAFGESRIGGRAENQDALDWRETSLGYLVTVCDGMGGGPGGRTASVIATREIVEAVCSSGGDESPENVVVKAVRCANMAIIEAGIGKPQLKGMGSTATVLLLTPDYAVVAHVGDSRVYQLRGRRKVFRTFDHSMVFQMVAQRVITEEQARLSAQSNVITRALGVKPDVEVECQTLTYDRGDRFLLTTDGVHGSMPEKELLRLALRQNTTLGATADNIATVADNIGRTGGGGHDNLTLALVETTKNSKQRPKMTKKAQLAIIALAALAAASMALNVSQCGKRTAVATVDTLAVKRMSDSLRVQDDSIKTLRQALSDIERQARTISQDNIAGVDSIDKIIKKTK